MYETYYNGIHYCFFDDHLSLNDIDLKYQFMNNIKHRGGDSPAFVFDYVSRTVALPYPPEELPQILPYFRLASQTFPNPDPVELVSLEDVSAEPEPVESYPVYDEPVYDEPVAVEPPPVPVPERATFEAPPASAPAVDSGKDKKKGCLVFIILIAALIIILFACIGGGDGDSEDYDAAPDDTVMTEPATDPTTTEADPLASLNTEERNAYSAALAYLSTQGFSRSGLIKQLQYEQYSDSACEKAVSFIEENGEVDWTEECLESAKNYMDSGMSFSKDGLIKQLQFEGFSDEQINAIIDQAYQ